jgi:two-component SAPR family response regulator
MKQLRILIVEDEPLIALELEMMVSDFVAAAILVEVSVAATKQALHQDDLDFAFLDVDVINGKTFELAQILGRKHVPFVFVSGSPQDQLPSNLRDVPFIPKPFFRAQIERALESVAN